MIKSLRVLQSEVEAWCSHNFPNAKPHQPLLGLTEEVGELAHAHLKMEQGIRGHDLLVYTAAASDAIGDIVVFLADYCRQNGIDLYDAVWDTWEQVKQRDWIKYPNNGVSK